MHPDIQSIQDEYALRRERLKFEYEHSVYSATVGYRTKCKAAIDDKSRVTVDKNFAEDLQALREQYNRTLADSHHMEACDLTDASKRIERGAAASRRIDGVEEG